MTRILALAAAALLTVAAPQVQAGDCTGWVVGLRPISQYNHAAGNGFLAVRTGPGAQYQQIGEVYLGDEISVWNRAGNWYQVQCMSGRCTAPLWGAASPNGWVHGSYLNIGGVCP